MASGIPVCRWYFITENSIPIPNTAQIALYRKWCAAVAVSVCSAFLLLVPPHAHSASLFHGGMWAAATLDQARRTQVHLCRLVVRVVLAVPATDPIALTGDSENAPELLAFPISAEVASPCRFSSSDSSCCATVARIIADLAPPSTGKRLFVFTFGCRSYFLQIWGRLYFLSVFSHQLYFLWFEEGLVVFLGNISSNFLFFVMHFGRILFFFLHCPPIGPTNRHAPATHDPRRRRWR